MLLLGKGESTWQESGGLRPCCSMPLQIGAWQIGLSEPGLWKPGRYPWGWEVSDIQGGEWTGLCAERWELLGSPSC